MLSPIVWQVANTLAGMDRVRIVILVWNTFVQLLAFLTIALLMAELRDRLQREQALSRTDALTGLPNASAMRDGAELEVDRARRWRRPLSLAFVDLDGFKVVNDTLGHATGDGVFRVAAAAFRSGLRFTDLAVRVGGDEFVLLLPETDESGARTVLDAARERLEEQMRRRGWAVTASVGSVTAAEPRDAEDLFREVDARMYEAKRARQAAGPRPGEPVAS